MSFLDTIDFIQLHYSYIDMIASKVIIMYANRNILHIRVSEHIRVVLCNSIFMHCTYNDIKIHINLKSINCLNRTTCNRTQNHQINIIQTSFYPKAGLNDQNAFNFRFSEPLQETTYAQDNLWLMCVFLSMPMWCFEWEGISNSQSRYVLLK